MKTFASFAELGAALNIRRKREEDKPVSKKCFKCGGDMVQIPGTNVFACLGNGNKPCDEKDKERVHYALQRAR